MSVGRDLERHAAAARVGADDVVAVTLERRGEAWHGQARRGGATLVAANGDSPGEVLEDLALELDAEETARIVEARRADRERAGG